jgi:hypothetical protein
VATGHIYKNGGSICLWRDRETGKGIEERSLQASGKFNHKFYISYK